MSVLAEKPAVQNAAETNEAELSHYGFVNHFVFSEHHKETASQYGLSIHNKDGRFIVRSANGAQALKNLVSPFSDVGTEGSATLSRKTLKSFLNFLHRPIDHVMRDDKKIGHHLSRFLTTGKAEIPLFVDDALENAKSLDCHKKGQRKMQEDDAWRSEAEIANPKYEDEPEEEHVKLPSAIPGTSYDPGKGFVFQVATSHVEGFEGHSQTLLSNALWGAINKITKGRYAVQRPAEIALNAQELKALYQELQLPELQTLINATITEEKAQQLYANTRQDSKSLKQDARFKQALDWQSEYLAPEEKLKNIALATSILTPIIKSNAVFEAWKHEFFTEYKLGLTNSPEDIGQQLDALQATVHKMLLTGQTSDAEVQALVNNSKKLLSFVFYAAESIGEATEHKKATKYISNEDAERIKSKMDGIQKALGNASVNGIESGEPEGYYDELLTSLQSAFGQNGNVVKQALVGSFNTWKGFWEGVVESVYDSPPAFAFLASLVVYAYYTKYGTAPEQELVQQAVDTVFSGWDGEDGKDIVIDQDTIERGRQAHEMLIAEARGTGEVDEVLLNPNVHYNRILPQPVLDLFDGSVSKYLQYRHWVGQDIIASNAMTAQDLLVRPFEVAYQAADIPVNHSSTFKDVSQSVTETAGVVAVDANTFQDGSHATMGGYAVYRGAKYGPGAAKGMTGLAAEFINPVRKMALPLWRPAQNSAAFTVGVAKPEWGAALIMPKKQNHRRNLLETTLGSIGTQEDLFFEPYSKDNALQTVSPIKPADLQIGLGWYGIKREKISLNEDNLKLLKIALNKLALTLQYSSDDIGIEAESYAEFTLAHLTIIEEAIYAYEQVGDVQKLKKALNGPLQHVMAAELKFNNRDDIYSALFPDQDDNRFLLRRIFDDTLEIKDNRRRGVLKRHASKKHGRLGRKEKRQDFAEQSKGTTIKNQLQGKQKTSPIQYAWAATKTGYLKTKFRMAQALTGVAGGIVNTAREGIHDPLCQIPLKKKGAVALMAIGGTGVALDMAGVKNIFVQSASGMAATVTSTANSGAIFVGLNIPQDAALHTVAVAVCMGLGAKWYYAVNRGLNPLASATNEARRSIFTRKPKYTSNDLH